MYSRQPIAVSVGALFLIGLLANGCHERQPTGAPPPPAAARAAQRQEFPGDPFLQRLVDAGARIYIGPSKTERPRPKYTDVTFERKVVDQELSLDCAQVRDLAVLDFKSCVLQRGSLAALRGLKEPVVITFQDCQFPSGNLAELDGSSAVGAIDFHDADVNAYVFSGLHSLPHLERLSFNAEAVQPDSLRFLKLCPRLRVLIMRDKVIDDSALADLLAGHELVWLDVAHTQITTRKRG